MDLHEQTAMSYYLIALVLLILILLWAIYTYLSKRRKEQSMQLLQDLKRLNADQKARVYIYDRQVDEFYRFDRTAQFKDAEKELLFLGKLKDAAMFVREKSAGILSGKLPTQELLVNEKNYKNESVLKLTIQRLDQQNVATKNKLQITVHDITEGYRMQSVHRASHVRYNAAFNSMSYSVIFYDKEGLIEDLNELAVHDLYGKSKEDILSRDLRISDIFDVQNLDDNMQQIQLCVSDGKAYYESIITPMFDDEHHLTGMFSICRNVTYVVEVDRQHKENIRKVEEMREQMNRYLNQTDTILQDNDIELLIYDPHTHMVTLKNRFMEEGMKASVLDVLQWIPADERDRMMAMWKKMDNHEDRAFDEDFTTTSAHQMGEEKVRRISYMPIKDKDGNIIYYSGIVVDVTESVKMDREIELAHLMAQENEKIKNSFLKNVSADVQTPINTVLDNVELLSHDLSDEEQQQSIRAIQGNSMHLLDVVNDVLYYSRLEANRVEIKKADVDFGAQIESICQQAMDGIEGIGLTVKNPYEHLVVDMDIPNFTQIMRFVLKMISRFMSHGNVDFVCRYHNESLIIEVDTDGEGLTDEKKQAIDSIIAGNDDPDVVSNHLTATVIVKLVKLMGGRIDLQSNTGMGSTGWIILPCVAKEITMKNNK